MPVYNVQMESSVKSRYGPETERHELRDDLVGMRVVLERGSRPDLLILDVHNTATGIRCFARTLTGPAIDSTAHFPFDELGPSTHEAAPSSESWQYG